MFAWRVYGVALLLRLAPVLLGHSLAIGLDDMFQYDMLGRSLAGGDGYRWYAQADLDLIRRYLPMEVDPTRYDPRGVLTAFRAPLYPAFLALVYSAVGLGAQRLLAARLAQAALTALAAPLTYGLALRLLGGEARPARYAAWVVAAYPMLVVFPLALATENLLIVLLLGGVLALVRAGQTRRWGWFAAAGALLGLAALTRSVMLPAAGLAAVWAWLAWRERGKALALAGAAVLVVAPWVARNSLLYGRLTPIELSLGYNLYVGYHPQSTGTFVFGPSLDLLTIVDDAERDRLGTERALEFIRADPGRFWLLAAQRLGHFFGLERRALTYFYSNNFFGHIPWPALLAVAAVVVVPFIIVACSAAWGLAWAPWDRTTAVVPLLMLAYLAPHVLVLADDRMHLVLVPLLAVWAGWAWARGKAAPRPRRAALWAAGAAMALLLLNWGLELYRDADKLALLLGPGGNTTYFPY
jgi:4-amino-4-deoxy-L-arabinose transferase-like glycosyltransferase